MKSIRLAVSVFALSVACIPMLKATAAEPSAPAAARFYPLVGTWKGQGEMREGDQPAVTLTLSYQCRKASAGHAVSCEMNAANDKMAMAETDLFGVDPVSGKGHWYAVTNVGETHDHIADWPNAKTMTGYHGWNQDGKKMEEKVTFTFNGSRSMEFQSVVSADGVKVASFTGHLKR
jgi:hypothetical protein